MFKARGEELNILDAGAKLQVDRLLGEDTLYLC